MAQVSAGSMLAVTIHQVNADGAGPFECDMDETSNAVTTFTPLKVTNNIPGSFGLSAAKEKDFVINVQMPDKFNCIGASTGTICTVRCRNNAVAGPFGGCFAVQQTDGTGRTIDSAAGKIYFLYFTPPLLAHLTYPILTLRNSCRHGSDTRRYLCSDSAKPEGSPCCHRSEPGCWCCRGQRGRRSDFWCVGVSSCCSFMALLHRG